MHNVSFQGLQACCCFLLVTFKPPLQFIFWSFYWTQFSLTPSTAKTLNKKSVNATIIIPQLFTSSGVGAECLTLFFYVSKSPNYQSKTWLIFFAKRIKYEASKSMFKPIKSFEMKIFVTVIRLSGSNIKSDFL